MHSSLGAKPHALQRPDPGYQLSYRHFQRGRQTLQGARPRDHRPPLDLPERESRDPGPRGELTLRQLPVVPQSGNVRGDALAIRHAPSILDAAMRPGYHPCKT